jgi:hypothetical protein
MQARQRVGQGNELAVGEVTISAPFWFERFLEQTDPGIWAVAKLIGTPLLE